eukprot:Nk52_evm3s353 gene=Nk52_evmTU3s353
MIATNVDKDDCGYGIEVEMVPDFDEFADQPALSQFVTVCVPLAHPKFDCTKTKVELLDESAKIRESELLHACDGAGGLSILGSSSKWLNLDSDNNTLRKNSELVLKEELAWAVYLGLHGVILPTPSQQCCNYGRFLNSILKNNLAAMHHCVRIPIMSGENEDFVNGNSWEKWNQLRSFCGHDSKIQVALELTADLPDENIRNRWKGEPVKTIIIPASIFLNNASGYPVLTKPHVDFIHQMLYLKAYPILKMDLPCDGKLHKYMSYIDFVKRTQPKLSYEDEFASGYEDFLQSPLQPLMDNLESQTYEIFEKDPVKYVQYEEAVYRALLDRVPEKDAETVTTTIIVVGAGRGPLVSASLRAGKRAQRKVKLFAVEKNPNAVIKLHQMNEMTWDGVVTIVASDMRKWDTKERADIMVSELLGSFGDNELSPECLDGAQSFLKEGGISIPCKYTSYVAPLHSAKLFNEVQQLNDRKGFEIPYVVKFRQVNVLCESKPCFEFEHPNKAQPVDNSRFEKISFKIKDNSIIHGIAGFFDAILYKDVLISINPQNESKGMFSWFPMYFPLSKPIYAPAETEFNVHFWRLSANYKVWYEWSVSSATSTSNIHNQDGHAYSIGL